MANTLLLIPLDDTVVFPNMSVTLPIDVGDEERVLLVPRARKRVRQGRRCGLGGRARAAARRAPGGLPDRPASRVHRRRPGRAPTASCASTVEEHPDEPPAPVKTRELEREYRAVVEEMLELRGDDGRVSAFLRSITEPGALADTCGYSPDLSASSRRWSCSRRWTWSSG